jgi:hypothetical protein
MVTRLLARMGSMRIGTQILNNKTEKDFKTELRDQLKDLHSAADAGAEEITKMEGKIHSIIIEKDIEFDKNLKQLAKS